MDRLNLGAESLVVHRQGRRLHDDDLGQPLRPSQPLFEQGGCAFGLVSAGQPEVGGGGAFEQILDEREAITTSTTHTPMVTHGLCALMRANSSVKGESLQARTYACRRAHSIITRNGSTSSSYCSWSMSPSRDPPLGRSRTATACAFERAVKPSLL